MAQVQEGLRHHAPGWLSLGRLVTAVAAGGVVSVALLLWLSPQLRLPEYLIDPAPVWLLILFTGAAALSDVIYVPVRLADSWEELTFVEVVLVVSLLTLAPLWVIGTALVGFAAVGVTLRRPWIKTLFNVGAYALSGTAMIVSYYAIAQDSALFSLQSVAGLLVGALAFTVINMFLLSLIFLVVEGVPISRYVSDQWQLTIGMAVGSVGVAAVALSIGSNDPVLIPFALLPAVAMWFVYKANSAGIEARQRGEWLAQLSQVLAVPGSPGEVIPRAISALRRVYRADDYAVRLGSGARFGAEGPWQPPDLMPREVRTLSSDSLPDGWYAGVAVRLDDQSGAGVLAVGSRERRTWLERRLPWVQSWYLPQTDESELVALTSAVGSTLRIGQTLAALTRETAKLQAVVDNIGEGVCVVDNRGRISLWSPGAQRITGLAVSTSDEQHPDVVTRIIAVPAGGEGHEIEFERADGQQISLSVTRVDAWGSAATSVITIRDMTRERRAERLKSDFIATVSHELRTPITPIRGYADLLKRRWDRMSEEKRQKILETIEERADHLTRLVDDLLIAARSDVDDSLTVQAQSMDLVSVVADVARAFPDLESRLTVAESGPLLVHADPTRVAQILGNLLGNALKYTPAGTPVQIVFEPGDPTSVRVVDHGPGIAADEQEKVFDRFYRIEDPLTMKTGGSGLGLHISRQLAKAMGGDVTLESSPGAGATFTLLLPAEGE